MRLNRNVVFCSKGANYFIIIVKVMVIIILIMIINNFNDNNNDGDNDVDNINHILVVYTGKLFFIQD